MPNKIVFYPSKNSLGFLALGLSVVVLAIMVSVILVAVTVAIVVMAKQCARGRRHHFYRNVYCGGE